MKASLEETFFHNLFSHTASANYMDARNRV